MLWINEQSIDDILKTYYSVALYNLYNPKNCVDWWYDNFLYGGSNLDIFVLLRR
jgi:hypothetical protein